MKVVDVIAEILKREGVEFLSCYPTNTMIEAAATAGIRPIVCRQERVGVGIADGFSRVTNGKRIGVFSMQAGPGAENAYSGITTAYSDSTPILLLPVGHARNTSQVHRFFRSVEAYASVTKWTEEITLANQVPEIMRRAFSYMKMGRSGPVLVEIPNDAAIEEFPASAINYTPVKRTVAGANVKDVEEAAKVLVQAKCPVIIAGQGVLWADATTELIELAELLQAPVTTPLEGKSAFPEHHSLSLGTGAGVMPRPVHTFLQKADVIFAIGASLTKHSIVAAPIPAGKTIIHATNDERDINKHYAADYPILGDAKPVLQQFIEAVKDLSGWKVAEGRFSRRGNQKRQRRVVGGMAAETHVEREADQPLSRHVGVHESVRPQRRDRHPRRRQSAQSARALLPSAGAAQLSRLGQVPRAGDRTRTSSWAPSSPRRKSSASTSWAMPPSA